MYLQDWHTFAPLRTQILPDFRKFCKISAIFPDFAKFCVENVQIACFLRNFRGISPDFQEITEAIKRTLAKQCVFSTERGGGIA